MILCALSNNCGMTARVGRPSGPATTKHFVREWREHRDLSQEDVADRLSQYFGRPVDRNRLSKKESGRERLDEDWIHALASSLNIEPGWIFVRPDVILRQQQRIEAIKDASDEEIGAVLAFIRARKAS